MFNMKLLITDIGFVAVAEHIVVETGAAKIAEGGVDAVSASAFGTALKTSCVGKLFLKLGKLGDLNVDVLDHAVAKACGRAVVLAAVIICLSEISQGGVYGRFFTGDGHADFLNFNGFGGLLSSCRENFSCGGNRFVEKCHKNHLRKNLGFFFTIIIAPIPAKVK